MFIHRETGAAVALVGQDNEAHFRAFEKPNGKVQSVPSHVFFADYREATADEREEHAPPASTSDPMKEALARAEAAAKAAEKSASAAADHEAKAKTHATAAAESARVAKLPPAKA